MRDFHASSSVRRQAAASASVACSRRRSNAIESPLDGHSPANADMVRLAKSLTSATPAQSQMAWRSKRRAYKRASEDFP